MTVTPRKVNSYKVKKLRPKSLFTKNKHKQRKEKIKCSTIQNAET